MNIDEQISKLLRLKAKIDLYKKFENALTGSAVEPALENTHPGLYAEFVGEVGLFYNKRIQMLSNDTPIEPKPAPQAPRTESNATTQSENPTAPAKKEVPIESNDPIRFLMRHRHLDQKRVQFTTKDGIIQGVVRGMAAPFIVVETTTGFTVQVPPGEITEL